MPLLRAKLMLDKADKLAQKGSETGAEREEAKRLLVHARYQLQMAEALGYGDQKRYEQLTQALDKVEPQLAARKATKGTFNELQSLRGHGRDPDDPARLGIPSVLRVSVSISGPRPTRRSTIEGASWRATRGSDFNCDSHATMGEAVAPVEIPIGSRLRSRPLFVACVSPDEAEEGLRVKAVSVWRRGIRRHPSERRFF